MPAGPRDNHEIGVKLNSSTQQGKCDSVVSSAEVSALFRAPVEIGTFPVAWSYLDDRVTSSSPVTRSRIRQNAGEYARILANAATNEWRRTCETVIKGHPASSFPAVRASGKVPSAAASAGLAAADARIPPARRLQDGDRLFPLAGLVGRGLRRPGAGSGCPADAAAAAGPCRRQCADDSRRAGAESLAGRLLPCLCLVVRTRPARVLARLRHRFSPVPLAQRGGRLAAAAGPASAARGNVPPRSHGRTTGDGRGPVSRSTRHCCSFRWAS